MKRWLTTLIVVVGLWGYTFAAEPPGLLAPGQWTSEKAWAWYGSQPWLVGCNFLPSTAVNDVEMWQPESFDAKTIDRELGWAQELGFNTVRVFVNYAVWEADAAGLKTNIQRFLEVADKHGVSTVVILFDDCFKPEPRVGKQPDPEPGVHNSQWVQSPGVRRRDDHATWPKLEQYVKDVVGGFASDKRVLAWEIYNEPTASLPLVETAFSWAREGKASQPVTATVFGNAEMQRRIIELSDVLCFHNYGPLAGVKAEVARLLAHGRPVLCTEWMARGAGSRFETHLPFFKENKIACWSWGLVAGRTQTYFPWGSPKGAPEPAEWHHDLLRPDGTPFKAHEVELIKLMTGRLAAVELKLSAPLEYQVVQRLSAGKGTLSITGEIAAAGPSPTALECRIHCAKAGQWVNVPVAFEAGKFSGVVEAPAGGWYRVDVRVWSGGQVLAQGSVEHVGVGEVFVVAGQSNAANYGEERQTPRTGRVATFEGTRWRLAADPQPGASGAGGSFLPALGDAIVERCQVPVGFIACGIGATSVREWLPKGNRFPNPPTIESRVKKLANGEWESQGEAFEMLTRRLKSLGPDGSRAVLWHQGESDANQQDPTRTLPGSLYREYLETVIRQSRRAIGWEVPWFVAQVSYHGPDDEGSPDIRAAQASLWKDGVAHEGPDTDALKGNLREAGGSGVHFSGPGLREHAARWAEKLLPWLEQQ
jgi:hypothetical protein